MTQNKQNRHLHSVTKKDFIIQPFKGSGPGGQHRNKNATAIRIIHPESGAKAESQEHKSQNQNKKAAFKRLIETDIFKKWHRIKIAEELHGKQKVQEQIDKWMNPHNIKIETKDKNGKWIKIENPD